jgi:hypothetical protein
MNTEADDRGVVAIEKLTTPVHGDREPGDDTSPRMTFCACRT